MNANQWLDKAKQKENIKSEYKLAKIIGIEQSGLANIRRRKNGMDNYTAVRVAEILEIERLKVIIDMEIEKAKNNTKKVFWEKKKEIYL